MEFQWVPGNFNNRELNIFLWIVHLFFIKKGESGDASDEPIFIHFDFEHYFGTWMGRIDAKKNFVYKRIIPPGRTTFFFTANEMQTSNKKFEECSFEHESLIKVIPFVSLSIN